MNKLAFSLILFLSIFCFNSSNGQNNGLKYYKIISDTLLNSSQRAFLLSIEKDKFDEFVIDVVHSNDLTKTSDFGKSNLALAAINGGFFDMEKGNSVSFVEKWDRMISPTISKSKMLDGVFIVEKEGDIILEEALADSIYLMSRKEESILGTGPLLLKGGAKMEIEESKFSSNRHPRSCICESEEEILFIVIDGRSSKAHGMSLFELQDFLLDLNCIDALNLDGGGSSTLWIRGKDIVNSPSDKNGERPVANAIVIKPK